MLEPPTTIDRYFTLHYGCGMTSQVTEDDDQRAVTHESENNSTGTNHTCVARHHNGICVICLAPEHPIISRRLQVLRVEFREGVRQVQGKKKRGGTFLESNSKLATIFCRNGKKYAVFAAVRGILVEVNEELEREPNLVATSPLTSGYLGVILPKPSERATATDHLISRDKLVEQ